MRKKIIRRIILGAAIAAVLLIVSVVGPFMHCGTVSADTKKHFAAEKFFSNTQGPDRVQLLETNISAWEERIRLLEQAHERIVMSTFDIRPDESAKDMLAMILHKADEGVKVQILVDGVSGKIRMEGQPLFYAVSSHPNVDIKIYNMLNLLQPWKSQGRMHDKYMIVDSMAYILGGRNTFDYFLGDYVTSDRSRDREVLVYNALWEDGSNRASSLWQVEDYFNEVWNLDVCTYFHKDAALQRKSEVQTQIQALSKRYEKIRFEHPGLFQNPDYDAATVPSNRICLVSNPTGIYGKEPVVFYVLSGLMKQAKKQVTIHMPYAVCNGYMYDALEEICAKVPDVHMMVNSVENGDNVVASSDYLKFKGRLLDTGIRMLEYDGGESYHGKSIVLDDDIAMIGSYNLDLRSTYVDTEVMLVIQSEPFVSQIKPVMETMEQDCRIVIDKDHSETPHHIHVADVGLGKRILWGFLGIILQPFRVLI